MHRGCQWTNIPQKGCPMKDQTGHPEHLHHQHGHVSEVTPPPQKSIAIPEWAKYLIGAALVGFIAYSVLQLLRQRAIDTASAEWYGLDRISGTDGLKELAAKAGTTFPGKIAKFKLAREDLRNGLRDFAAKKLSETKAKDAKALPELASIEALKKAATAYGELARTSGLPRVLEIEANLGAAKASEALGAFAEAKTFYETTVKLAGDSDMGKQAAAGAERLGKNELAVKTLQDELLKTARGPSTP